MRKNKKSTNIKEEKFSKTFSKKPFSLSSKYKNFFENNHFTVTKIHNKVNKNIFNIIILDSKDKEKINNLFLNLYSSI